MVASNAKVGGLGSDAGLDVEAESASSPGLILPANARSEHGDGASVDAVLGQAGAVEKDLARGDLTASHVEQLDFALGHLDGGVEQGEPNQLAPRGLFRRPVLNLLAEHMSELVDDVLGLGMREGRRKHDDDERGEIQ